MNSMPAASAICAKRLQSAQLPVQRSGSFVTARPEEQFAPKRPIFSRCVLPSPARLFSWDGIAHHPQGIGGIFASFAGPRIKPLILDRHRQSERLVAIAVRPREEAQHRFGGAGIARLQRAGLHRDIDRRILAGDDGRESAFGLERLVEGERARGIDQQRAPAQPQRLQLDRAAVVAPMRQRRSAVARAAARPSTAPRRKIPIACCRSLARKWAERHRSIAAID